MANEYPYSASFRLYRPDGLNILFTVRGEDPAGHVNDLAGYLNSLEATGYLAAMPGTEADEKVEEVDAWVLGETSDGSPCVYLYSSNHALKWKVATVYVEKLQELPFPVGRSATWPGSAPEREVAEKKKYLHTADPFKIVLKATGKQTDSGSDIMKFDRLLAPAVTVNGNGHRVNGNGGGNGNGNGKDPFEEWFGGLPDGEKAAYRAAGDGRLAYVITRYVSRYGFVGAADGALAKFCGNNLPEAATREEGLTRILLFRRVRAYAGLRDAGMEPGRAEAGALSQHTALDAPQPAG